MLQIEQEVDIRCPVQKVFGYMANIANHQSFCGAFTQTLQLSPGLFGIGTQVQKISSFLGKEIVARQEVTAYETNRMISFETISGPVSGQEHYLFEETTEGTKVKVILLSKPPGLFSLALPFLKAKINHQLAEDLQSLKRIMETGKN